MQPVQKTMRRDAVLVRRLEQVLARVIAESELTIVAAYLHGSWASAYQREDSDLDLAILAQRRLGLDERLTLGQCIAAGLNPFCEVDLADLQDANTVFAANVICGGERVYSNGLEADRFEVKTLAAYARLNEERQALLQDIIRRGTIYAPAVTEPA